MHLNQLTPGSVRPTCSPMRPLPLSGPSVAKSSGRKPILLLASVIFLVGNLVCALAHRGAMLIAGRAIQGAGGGGLIILVNITTISDLFSMRGGGKYFGFIGMVWATASATGPVIGGALAEKVSCRWCFYINLPCHGAAFLVLLLFLKVYNPRTGILEGLRAIDWVGSLVVIGALLMLLLGLQFGGITHPWDSATIVCLIIFSVIVFVVFFVIEWKVAKYPLIPLRIFKKRAALAALAVPSTHGFAFVAAAYFLPFYFQVGLGASPINSTVWFLPLALVLALFSIVTGGFIKKTGHYVEFIVGGLVFATLGFGLFIDLPSYKSWARIVIFQIIAAVGSGPNFQAPLIAMQTNVTPADIATGTATFGFTRNFSSAISIVIGGVIIQNRMLSHADELGKAEIPQKTINLLAGGTAGSAYVINQLSDSQRSLIRDAVADSVSGMWIFYACMLFVGLLASLGIGRTQLSKKHDEHKTGLATEEANRLAHEKKVVEQEEAGS
ncbi:hypothetical protein JMJ35_003669 [Cladonia borealis]|uniref:Major facilitator superfamily (MFS) profile domain-containing protein n=1 Tax=Cladonia borealis TaxID=184061 RepID=A0AA39R2Z7_9LECA|nr:hypothetical protein JMJ35_003669 [Cladonia borealis]